MESNKIPDVTALPLDQALKLLEKHGVSYYVKKALPVRPLGTTGKVDKKEQQHPVYRVIRQIDGEGMVELVVAPEAAAK